MNHDPDKEITACTLEYERLEWHSTQCFVSEVVIWNEGITEKDIGHDTSCYRDVCFIFFTVGGFDEVKCGYRGALQQSVSKPKLQQAGTFYIGLVTWP